MKIYIVLFVLSIVALQGLLGQGFPLTHDGPDHVARIASFYESLSEGNIFPRWAGNLNWGYGHPILMFLYPLPSYFASFFHFIHFSFADSTKLVFGLFYVASFFTMYLWLSNALSRQAAFVGSLLYGFGPYRFIDLYVRGAIGEHAAFIFPPLILFGLLTLSKREKYIRGGIWISLGTAGLLLSHNALSVLFFPIIALYGCYLFFWEVLDKKKFIIYSIAFFTLGLLLSAFFVIPAYFEGKYTLRDIVTKGEYSKRFVDWLWFFKSSWNFGGSNEFSKEIGLIQWLLIGVSFPLLYTMRLFKTKIFLITLLVIFFVSLFMMTSYSGFLWERITILEKFQFPWRFLSLSVFIAAVIGAVVVDGMPKKVARFVIIGVVVGLMVTTYTMWRPSYYVNKPDEVFKGIYHGTTDTGESSPIWSIRFMEKSPVASIEIIKGEGNIIQLERTNERHAYTINVVTPEARVLENTLYFPGWTLLIDGKEVPVSSIEFQNPIYRGLMTFSVPVGSHSISLEFRETKLRKIANGLSFTGIGVLLGFILMPYLTRRKALRT